MDVDLSTDLRALLPLVAPLLSGHSDLAIGTRLAAGSRVVRGPEARADLARATTAILHTALRARFSDAQCGFKAVARRRAARTCSPTCATTAGSSTPSCSCSPSAAGCGSTRCRSTGSTTRTRASTSCARRSTTCAASRGWWPPRRWRASWRRRRSTLAYALLFLLLRGALGAGGANAVALALTAVGNTAANRRLTFGVRGRAGLVRQHVRGAVVFVLTLGADERRARVLHGLDADAAARGRAGGARRRRPGRDRDPLRRAAHLGVRPPATRHPAAAATRHP